MGKAREWNRERAPEHHKTGKAWEKKQRGWTYLKAALNDVPAFAYSASPLSSLPNSACFPGPGSSQRSGSYLVQQTHWLEQSHSLVRELGLGEGVSSWQQTLVFLPEHQAVLEPEGGRQRVVTVTYLCCLFICLFKAASTPPKCAVSQSTYQIAGKRYIFVTEDLFFWSRCSSVCSSS